MNSEIISLLLQYRYLILFPLAVIEGPILSVIGGFFVSLGIFNPVFVYVIVLAGDIIGDTVLYLFGHFAGKRGGVIFIERYGKYLGVNAGKIERARKYFAQSHFKAVAFSKLIHGIGSAGLVAAGVLEVPYFAFIKTCFIITLAQATLFLTIGIFFGSAYVKIGEYLDFFAATTFAVAALMIVFIILRRWKRA